MASQCRDAAVALSAAAERLEGMVQYMHDCLDAAVLHMNKMAAASLDGARARAQTDLDTLTARVTAECKRVADTADEADINEKQCLAFAAMSAGMPPHTALDVLPEVSLELRRPQTALALVFLQSIAVGFGDAQLPRARGYTAAIDNCFEFGSLGRSLWALEPALPCIVNPEDMTITITPPIPMPALFKYRTHIQDKGRALQIYYRILNGIESSLPWKFSVALFGQPWFTFCAYGLYDRTMVFA